VREQRKEAGRAILGLDAIPGEAIEAYREKAKALVDAQPSLA
jgi:hypothetical protein